MCVTEPPMKERLLRWIVFILLVITLVGGQVKEKKSKDDEDITDLRTNEVNEQDDATTHMLNIISNAIKNTPELPKVI